MPSGEINVLKADARRRAKWCVDVCTCCRMVNLFSYVTFSPKKKRRRRKSTEWSRGRAEKHFHGTAFRLSRRYMLGEFLISLIIRLWVRREPWAVVERVKKKEPRKCSTREKLLAFLSCYQLWGHALIMTIFAVLIFSTYIAIHFSLAIYFMCPPTQPANAFALTLHGIQMFNKGFCSHQQQSLGVSCWQCCSVPTQSTRPPSQLIAIIQFSRVERETIETIVKGINFMKIFPHACEQINEKNFPKCCHASENEPQIRHDNF